MSRGSKNAARNETAPERLLLPFRKGRFASSFVLEHAKMDCPMFPAPIRFSLTDDFAMAGYFLMAHWPRAETAPQLVPIPRGPMSIVVDGTPAAISDLHAVLRTAKASGGALAQSADAWSQQLERSLPTECRAVSS